MQQQKKLNLACADKLIEFVAMTYRVRPPSVLQAHKPPVVRPDVYQFTDWELSNPMIKPQNPDVGGLFSVGATLKVLSTNAPFPQAVRIQVTGSPDLEYAGDAEYSGPVGSAVPFWIKKAWTLKAGGYKVVLIADYPPPYVYNDPNRNNNRLEFLVAHT